MLDKTIVPQVVTDLQPLNCNHPPLVIRVAGRLAGVILGLALAWLLTAYPPSPPVVLAGTVFLALAFSEVGGVG